MSLNDLSTDVLGEIASYSQVPRMRRVSRELREVEQGSYLQEQRERNMSRRYPEWKEEEPFQIAEQIGDKGTMGDWYFYMRYSPAFKKFIEDQLPYYELANHAISHDNKEVIHWLIAHGKINDDNRTTLFHKALVHHVSKETLRDILLSSDIQEERLDLLEAAARLDTKLFEYLASQLSQEDIDLYMQEGCITQSYIDFLNEEETYDDSDIDF